MKKQKFIFQKIETGGTLHVEATTEESARKKFNLSSDLWRLLDPLPDPPLPPSE